MNSILDHHICEYLWPLGHHYKTKSISVTGEAVRPTWCSDTLLNKRVPQKILCLGYGRIHFLIILVKVQETSVVSDGHLTKVGTLLIFLKNIPPPHTPHNMVHTGAYSYISLHIVSKCSVWLDMVAQGFVLLQVAAYMCKCSHIVAN